MTESAMRARHHKRYVRVTLLVAATISLAVLMQSLRTALPPHSSSPKTRVGLARPKISAQPLDAAVQPGQDARLRVTASGEGPLTYQWRFEGRELAGATNQNLILPNVTLSDLGRYDVIVRDSAGAVTSDAARLSLASGWTELVVFGASAEMPVCGGSAWPEYLANWLGVPLRNYARPGARSSAIRSQITSYLRSNTPTQNTLVGHWAGGSFIDLRFGLSPEQAAANRLANVRLLVNAGARHILIPTMWPPEVVPKAADNFPAFTSEVVAGFDALVSEGLNALQGEHGLTVYRPDMFPFFMALAEDPAAYGFSVPPGADFCCDGGHFSSAVHRLASQELCLSLIRPLRVPDGRPDVRR